MRMAPHELVGKSVKHIVDREGAGFRGDLAVKEDLKQHVTEFLELFGDPDGRSFPAPRTFLQADRASTTHAFACDPMGSR